MAVFDYAAQKLGQGITSMPDYLKLEEEFQLKKQQLAQEAELNKAKIQRSLSGGDDPAAIQIANEIQKRRLAGDEMGAQLLENTAKIYDKGLQYDPSTGGFIDMRGYGAGLGNLKYGENLGGETATQQVKSAYEPERAGMIEQQKLEQQLSYDPRIKEAVKAAESGAERKSELKERIASLPQLEATVRKLSDLGKVATYTKTGQLVDIVRRETGAEPREAAIARKEYIALVDNQILPLLRQTFGAQFTQKEGESLKTTLGDPDASPEEKDAVLRSFIDQKIATIETMQRQMQQDPLQSSRDAILQRNAQRPDLINPNQTLPGDDVQSLIDRYAQ